MSDEEYHGMVPGGIDLIFKTPRHVDVLEVVTRNFRTIWPELVVMDAKDGAETESHEYFIEKTQALADRGDYYGDNTLVTLYWSAAGQTVRHYLQSVTIVVDELTEEMFGVINAIQTEFLRGYQK